MSASTVSITANPSSTRRRSVLVSETKKSSTSIGLVGDDGFVSQTNGDDKTSGGRDLNRSIGGDSVPERSRDLLQVKKTTVNATVLPRRARKNVVKPKWAKVMSVFTKNFVLLVVLLGLVQMIRKFVMNGGGGGDGSGGISSREVMEFEKRITQTESLLKTTTKMMQAQVEVVDRKLEGEVGGLRRELGKKIKESGAMIQEELKRIGGRTEGLEKSLSELRAMDLMSKDDFDRFYTELKKDSSEGDGDSGKMLDDIRASLKEMLELEFEKHGADGIGRPDYALATGGGTVVKHSEPLIGGKSWKLGRVLSSDADRMLRPSFGEPGQCFPLKGSSGFVQIKLRTAIVPEAITLEHVDKSVAYDSSSAPKDCQITGWLQKHDIVNLKTADEEEKKFPLVEFTYGLEKSNIQTYDVPQAEDSEIVVNTIRLDFTSNYGSPHTCIYRLRVHGHEPSDVSVSDMQA